MSQSNFNRISALAHPLHFDADRGRFEKERSYEKYVRGLVLQVLLTGPGERVNRPDFGTAIAQRLFGPIDDQVGALVEAQIRRSLKKWLNRVIVVERVEARTSEQTTLTIEVSYVILATGSPSSAVAEVA